MVKMSLFETFLVNRIKGYANERVFQSIRGVLRSDSEATWLEIGCGKGDMAYRLVNEFHPGRYIATDRDTGQVERSRRYLAQRYNGGVPPNLELRTADALHLPFPNASVDVVFAFAVLHHVEDHFWRFGRIPTALEEIRRVLKPGGQFVYEEWVNKERVRDHLHGMGFRVSATKIHRGLAEVVNAVRTDRAS